MVDELADSKFVVHDPSSEVEEVDAQGVKGSIAWSHSAFPDLRVMIEDQVAEGGKVATRWTRCRVSEAWVVKEDEHYAIMGGVSAALLG